jgi:hypothetical protein
MTPLVRLRLQVFKEVRELLPAWTACLSAVAIFAILEGGPGLAMIVYCFGTAGLGALAIGQEYGHGTLPILLAQPAGRARLLATKMGSLALMLAPICAAFGVVLHTTGPVQTFAVDPADALLLPLLGALFIAPWFTMLARSPVAGAVFAVSVVALFMGFITQSLGAPPAVAFWGVLALSVIAAVAGPRRFMRLEAIDGRRSGATRRRWLPVRSSGPSPSRTRTRRHPVWLLIKKELRLQRMTFVIGSLYPVSWTIAVLLRPHVKNALDIFYLGSVFHQTFTVALLSGALAGAEERRAGTLEWQLLMPITVSKQWLIKVAVVLATTLVLGCVVPAFPAYLAPTTEGWAPNAGDFVGLEMVSSTLLIAAVSLYVSSLSSSGLHALLVAIPVVAAATTIGAYFDLLEWMAGRAFAASLLLVIGSLILLTYAMRNHRSSDRSFARVLAQLAVVAIYLGAGAAAVGLSRSFAG